MTAEPTEPAVDEQRLHQVLEFYLREMEAGRTPDRRELLARHPDLADELAAFWDCNDRLHHLVAGQESRAPATEIRPEAPLGDFRIVREVGRGGMGIVYEAVQISLGRRVALKVLPFAAALDAKQLQRFKTEAQAAAQLHHTNIVPVHAVGCERGLHYYAMQFIDGHTLSDLIGELRRQAGLAVAEEAEATGAASGLVSGRWAPPKQDPSGPRPVAPRGSSVPAPEVPAARTTPSQARLLPTEQSLKSPAFFRTVAHLALQAAEALEHAHHVGVVHRDVKPANLLVDAGGNVWITDFGLAQVRGDSRLTLTGDLVGTLRYMSPEQALGRRAAADHRTDLFSLGATLYELATLEPAFPGSARGELLQQIVNEEPRPPRQINPALPVELETIVLKAMAKEPDERYATARELADDLQRYLRDEPLRAKRPTLVQRARKWARRHQPLVWSAVVSAVVLLVLAVVALAVSNVLIDRERGKAIREERTAKERLYDARLAQAQANRYGRQPGQRAASWQALTEAAGLARELAKGEEHFLELRNEAIACLALPDVRPGRQWPGFPPGSSAGLAFDANLKRYARSDVKGNLSIRSVDDDRQLAPLPGDGPGGVGSGAAVMQFSPDGRLLAVRYWHRVAESSADFLLWDWERGVRVFQSAFAVDTDALDFSPDGRQLALGQSDGTVTIHEAATGAEVQRLQAASRPTHLAFHPEGVRLAVAGPELQVLDLASGQRSRKLPSPSWAWQVSWHPAGVLLAAACEDANVYLWDTATGRQHAVLQGHQGSVHRVTFSPDGNLLLSSAWDGTSRLWNPWTGQELARLPGDGRGFNRDGSCLASQIGSNLAVWQVAPSQEYHALTGLPAPGKEHPTGGDISPDGRWLALVGGGRVRLWDLTLGTEVARLPGSFAADARFDPRGRELFTCGPAGLHRWPLHTQEDALRIGPAQRLPVAGVLGGISLDRQGRALAVSTLGSTGGIQVLDLERPSGNAVRMPHANAASVALDPKRRWVAAGIHHGFGVKIWDAGSGKLLCHPVPDERMAVVSSSPDGRWLVIGLDSEFQVLDTESWNVAYRHPRKWGGGALTSFARDRDLLALRTAADQVQLVDPATGRPFATLQAPDAEPINWLGFTPDGNRLLTSPGARGHVHVWDLRRIREQLRAIGLDWDQPHYPAAPPPDGAKPVKIEVDPGDLGPLVQVQEQFGRGQEHARARQWHQAVAAYTRVIELQPTHAHAWHDRSLAHQQLREWNNAIADLSRAVELAEDARWLNNLAWMLVTCPEPRLHNAARALDLVQKAVRLKPKNGMYWNTLGVAQYRAGNWQAAVKTLEKSMSLRDGGDSYDFFFLALAHERLGQPEQARQWYGKAVAWMEKEQPADEELRRYRAEAAEQLKIASQKE